MKPDLASPDFSTVLAEFVQEKVLKIPPREEFVQQLISQCQKRVENERLTLEADPYEVYKDDEGFDYVFVY